MEPQEQFHYQIVAQAIAYIKENFKQQPELDDIAAKVHMSPFHFQRLFTDWAGVSPKKFLQYISIAYAKQVLKDKQATLFDVAQVTGLSGTSRLHDLFVKIEGMTPGEFKNGGANLYINYSFAQSPFGNILIASTHKGVCYMAFMEDQDHAFLELKQCFPEAQFNHILDRVQRDALSIFTQDWHQMPQIKLHLKGSAFQLKVWEALLRIPLGQLTTYGKIANEIQNPKASRAVGSAIGSNPIAFLIPCHRVIQSSGVFGGYMWGPTRKAAIIGWEAAKADLSK